MRFDYFWKISVCVWDKNFVASLARELMNRISWNFMFSITPIWIIVYQLLVEIVQQVALQSNNFQIFRDAQISASIEWIIQKFIYKIDTIRKNEGIIFVHVPH